MLPPPVYVLLSPFLLAALRLRCAGWRTFWAAASALGFGCAGVVFRAVPHAPGGPLAGGSTHALIWTAAVTAGGVTGRAASHLLLLIPGWLSGGGARTGGPATGREVVPGSLLQISLAILFAAAADITPFLLAAAVPVTFAQRRYAQLVTESRIDGKTGLLNAAAWHPEATAELARAART